MISIMIQATHNEYLSYLNVTLRLFIGHYATHVNVFISKDFTAEVNIRYLVRGKSEEKESGSYKRADEKHAVQRTLILVF
jgi:hypothetical protein